MPVPGYDPGAEALDAICRLPLSVINAERVFRKVHTFLSDRKAYEDQRPCIARQRIGLGPMDVMVADIHPIDILRRRDDGSVATPAPSLGSISPSIACGSTWYS
jgi:hypothetical protein